ncbi:hypothetical protein SAMN05421810_107158 [Amycolatopsis arida]|uniref:Uncharacterized protein n=1 Tax=Amycolatopsis arida TaxID=587909 RepID=A0A1I5YHC3_9PSEU|nr:hypothetical protein CLV69_107158 [Amycolatopsis arida]SFQ43540.1 hypothetical protein SAMN05421810_107158 [Amycolatopsis arida]
MTGCPWCVRDEDHCHGTLVVVTAVEVECSDPDCTDLDVSRHELVTWIDDAG